MLFRQDPRAQRCLGVVVVHGHSSLGDDGAGIELGLPDAPSRRTPSRREQAPAAGGAALETGKRDGWTLRTASGKASSSGRPRRRMKPARHTNPTPCRRSCSTIARS